MTTEVGELRARLTMESQQFRQRMDESRTNLSRLGNSTNDLRSRFQSLGSSLSAIGVSSAQIDKINERVKKANPQILQQMLNDVRTELQGIGMESSEIDKITAEIERAESGAMSFEEQLANIQTAAAGLGAAVVAAIGVSVKTAADFEAQMSRVKAISGATDMEFQNLEESALALGASTSKSASEVALGFEDMAAMGFNANEIIAAMPGVISAAEASGSDLAETAGIVASALNAFQMKASDATKVADVLAMTANISAASISDMGYALKYVGPVANALGISLEEVSAAIGIMTNAGIDGSSAGTSLRAALLALNNPAKAQEKLMNELGFSMKDANGNAKSLADIIGGLTESTKKMTQAEKVATIAKLVGTEASSGMIAVIEGGTDKLNEFTDTLRNSGGASKEAAGVMKDNLKGAYDELSGALETIGIKLGKEFLPLLTEVTKRGAAVVSSIAEMDMSSVNAGIAFAGTASAIALTITTIGRLAIAIKGLMVSMGPYGWLILGVSLLGGALMGAAIHTATLDREMLKNISTQIDHQKSIENNAKAYDDLRMKAHLTTEEFGRYLDITSELQKTTDPGKVKALTEEQDRLREKSGLSNDELDKMVGLNKDLVKEVPKATTEITKQGNAVVKNTDAIKTYSKEKLKSLYADLDLQRLKNESAYRDKLAEEERILRQIKKANQDKEDLIKKQTVAHSKLNDEQRVLNDMLSHSSSYTQQEIDQQRTRVKLATEDLNLATDRLSKQAATLEGKQKELDTIRKEIADIENIKTQMASILLAQTGITAKKGEEVAAIDNAISKLELQKKTLYETTPVNQRNTAQYREAVDAIQQQINNLNTTKSQLIELTNQASILNEELGKEIRKKIYQQVIQSNDYNNSKANSLKYHTGGIVGRGQMPTLHVGGSAAQFMNAPMHNEVDVRLLRDEWVLTEAQQANLFRMIDAGLTNNGNQKMNDSEMYRLLEDIKRAIQNGMNATVVMDSRQVGVMVEPHVTREQKYKGEQKGRF
jgi:TP901 family phage tail tape measure protein